MGEYDRLLAKIRKPKITKGTDEVIYFSTLDSSENARKRKINKNIEEKKSKVEEIISIKISKTGEPTKKGKSGRAPEATKSTAKARKNDQEKDFQSQLEDISIVGEVHSPSIIGDKVRSLAEEAIKKKPQLDISEIGTFLENEVILTDGFNNVHIAKNHFRGGEIIEGSPNRENLNS